jgi:predicted permease
MTLEMKHAARRLARAPAFTLAVMLTLALAIGANASIFAVVSRVVLNPLPYPQADRLIELDHGALSLNLPAGMGMTSGLYFHYADRSTTLERSAIYRRENATITGAAEPERIPVVRATPSLASVLRVTPALGRWFADDEGAPGGAQTAVLSHALWLRRFGGDSGVLGRTMTVDGATLQIVGVMPASFAFPDPAVEAWIVEQVTPTMGFGLWNYDGVARVRDGVTIDQVRGELHGLIADAPAAYPADPRAAGNVQTRLVFSGQSLHDATVGDMARTLWILLGSVGLVLLVACANVANLFLARSESRQHDMAIRAALGAGGSRIAQYLLSESILLAVSAGAAALGIAWLAVRLVVTRGPINLPRLHEVRLDAPTLAFTSALVAAAAFAGVAVPLWRSVRRPASIHETGRGNTATRRRHLTRHVLIGAQVALALVLLVAAGLMVRSFQKLRAVEPGFDPQSALTFSVGLPEREYPSRESAVAAHQAILDRLAVLPGVSAVSATTCLPLAGSCFGNTLLVEGRTLPPGTVPPLALFRGVAGGYLDAMRMRIVRGRSIERIDVEREEPIAIINEAAARTFFPGQDPIDARVASNRPPARPGELPRLTWLRIVGVVANTPLSSMSEATALPQLFLPMSIAGGPGVPTLTGPDVSVMSYVVRTSTPPRSLLAAARAQVDRVNRNIALAQVRTLQESVDRASAPMAFTMILIAVAAGITLMLGLIGIYGVTAYSVAQRTGEIGVRLALGADPRSVAMLVIRQGMGAAVTGVAAGFATALFGSAIVESLLFEVSARDPGVFAAASLGLLSVTVLACAIPAMRAARLSPLEALRE